jgi:hypothetical protein
MADFGFATWSLEELGNFIGPEMDDWLGALTLDEVQSFIDGCADG